MKLISISLSLMLAVVSVNGQGSSTPLYNAILQSDLDAAGFKILTADLSDYAGTNITWNVATNKFDATGGGGSGTVTSITAFTPIVASPTTITTTGQISLDPFSQYNWDTAYTDRLKWDGGATDLVATTGRTSLGLVIGTNVEAWLGNPSVNGYVLSSTTGGTRSWIAPSAGGGAPTTTDYLVGTADAGLSAEIVVGTSPGGELGGTWASPTLDDSVTVASWTLTTPTIAAISNLTTNGFVKTGGAIGTLSVDTATYQASDADLTTWAGVTPTSGIQTWLATPSSANLRGAVTDENGTGVLLFSGATSPIFAGATQFWNGSTSSGEIRILEDSDLGTNYASFKVPDLAAITAYTLPPDDGNSGDFLRSDGAGILTWVAPAGGGNVSNSGTPTVDQLGIWVTATTIKGLTTLPATNFPALTGDVTTTPGALGTTIGANKVTLAMMATMATDSILGRATASTGNVEVLSALPFAYTGDVTRPVDSNVTTLAAGNAGNLNSGTLLAARMPALTGEVTTTVGTVATTIADGITVANWTLTTPQIAAISNLTSNGFVKTSGSVGTLSVDTSTYLTSTSISDTAYAGTWDTVTTIAPSKNAVYDKIETLQPLDTDLTSLAGISGVRGDVLFYGASGWARLGVGTSGQQLTTGGAGADPTWAAAGSGGGGTPGGSTTQLQYNNAGAFGGITGATTDGTTLSLKNLNMIAASGTDNSTIDFGPNYNQPAIWLYNNGTGTRSGWGLRASEMQFFTLAGAHFSWNTGGDFQASGTSEMMRLFAGGGLTVGSTSDPGAGYINAATGFKIAGTTLNTTNWDTAFTQTRQWDGGATGLVAATGRTSLALNNVTNDAQTKSAIVPNTAPATGQVLVGNAGATAYAPVTVSGSGATITMAATGILTISAIANGSLSDADLTTWAGITPGTNVGTFLATPSSANLRSALTDENGTGAALFSGATAPDFTTGFTIGAAAASGKILVGNGTNYVPSTPTFPATASATSRKFIVSDGTNWVASTETQAVPGTSGNLLTSDGTNWLSSAPVVSATSTTTFTNKRINPRVVASATGNTTPTPDVSTTDQYNVIGMTVNMVFGAPTGTPVDGQRLIIRIEDSGSVRTIGWNAAYRIVGVTLPTTTVASKLIYVGCIYNSTDSVWDVIAVVNEA